MLITNGAYINMDHRVDKNQHIYNQLLFCPNSIQIQRFSGIKADDFLNYSVHSYIDVGSPRHKGIIGCWLAHKNLIKYFIDNILTIFGDWILILEDDIRINPLFWNYLLNLNPVENSDIIFFNSAQQEIPNEHIIDHNLQLYNIYTSFPIFVGTHCYAISKNSLNKVYNILDSVTIYKDIDGYFFGNNQIIKYNYQTPYISVNYNLSSDRLNPT